MVDLGRQTHYTVQTLKATGYKGPRQCWNALQWYSLSSHSSSSSSHRSGWISMRRLRQIICCWPCPQCLKQAEVFTNCQPWNFSHNICSLFNIANLNKITIKCMACVPGREEGVIWTKYFNTAMDKGDQMSAETKDEVSCSTVLCCMPHAIIPVVLK